MSEHEGSQVAQSLDSSSKGYKGELPLNPAVRVSINVSEHDHQLASACSPALSGVSAQQVRLAIVEGCNEGSSPPAAQTGGHSEEYIASPDAHQQPLPLSDSPTDQLQGPKFSPQCESRISQAAGSCEDANATISQPRYPPSPPRRPESSPDMVLTSLNSPPSAQQCPSPSSSAHLHTQECATTTLTCPCAKLLHPRTNLVQLQCCATVFCKLVRPINRHGHFCRFFEQDPTASITFLQERLHAKAEEIAGLKAELRRLQRSRMLSVEVLPTVGDTVTIPAAELSALRKDLEVCGRLPTSGHHGNACRWRNSKSLDPVPYTRKGSDGGKPQSTIMRR